MLLLLLLAARDLHQPGSAARALAAFPDSRPVYSDPGPGPDPAGVYPIVHRYSPKEDVTFGVCRRGRTTFVCPDLVAERLTPAAASRRGCRAVFDGEP